MVPNPADLTPSAVELPDPEVHDARVSEDAVGPDDLVRCVIPDHTERLTTDPLPWTPYVKKAGFFYPKKGDRAILAFPVDGPAVILEWWPKATEPDETF